MRFRRIPLHVSLAGIFRSSSALAVADEGQMPAVFGPVPTAKKLSLVPPPAAPKPFPPEGYDYEIHYRDTRRGALLCGKALGATSPKAVLAHPKHPAFCPDCVAKPRAVGVEPVQLGR